MSDARSEPYAPELAADDGVVRQGAGTRTGRRHTARWLAPLIGLLAAIALVSVLWQPQFGALRLAAFGPTASVPTTSGGSGRDTATLPAEVARYPIPVNEGPRPPLDASDALLEAGLRALAGGNAIAALLEPRDIVRSIVATVDNLPRRSLFSARMPVKPAPGPFETTFAPTGLAVADGNAARYSAYVRILERIDAARLVALYERHYPLFAQAFRDLGYPNGHFNDRLVEAIEVALDTPEVAPPLRVVQPKVHYEFVDRGLETLPAAQKLLLRMGPENAAIAKAKLAEFHALLTRHAAAPVARR